MSFISRGERAQRYASWHSAYTLSPTKRVREGHQHEGAVRTSAPRRVITPVEAKTMPAGLRAVQFRKMIGSGPLLGSASPSTIHGRRIRYTPSGNRYYMPCKRERERERERQKVRTMTRGSLSPLRTPVARPDTKFNAPIAGHIFVPQIAQDDAFYSAPTPFLSRLKSPSSASFFVSAFGSVRKLEQSYFRECKEKLIEHHFFALIVIITFIRVNYVSLDACKKRRPTTQSMGKQQRRCSMMSLLSLLATTTLVGLAQAGPLARTSSHNAAIQSLQIPVDRDRFLLILLVNQKDFVAEGKSMEDMLEYLNEHDAGTTSNEADLNVSSNGRDKRMGSLSIVNSVDVLRQRVLLELARRKAMEDQRQISENRRLLDSVGKRSSYPGSSIMARKKDTSAGDSSLEHDQLQRQFDELMMHVKFYRKKNKAPQAKIKNSESFAHFFISLSYSPSTLVASSALRRAPTTYSDYSYRLYTSARITLRRH
ncbi:unnamed protein product [Trichogramma brassicae]|uniref:Corticotropin-releasing factor domain-containing protein n=1 Tax=Trichogramma brassicae TaxID=86971 RepID=A0A6H5I4Q0_9HYME|nr:unnamed protein product [Trichogramma brassicae]